MHRQKRYSRPQRDGHAFLKKDVQRRSKSKGPKAKVASRAPKDERLSLRPGPHAKQPLLPHGVLTEALRSEDRVIRAPQPRLQALLEPEEDPEIKSEAMSFLRKGSVGRPLVRAVKREVAGKQTPPPRQMRLNLPRRLSPPQRKPQAQKSGPEAHALLKTPQKSGPEALLKTPSSPSVRIDSNADFQVFSSNMSDIDITPQESVRDPWEM